jgi:hypothetical protein
MENVSSSIAILIYQEIWKSEVTPFGGWPDEVKKKN